MGRFKASRIIVWESWNVLKQDKEIMWFPVMSSLISLTILGGLGLVYFFVVLGGQLSSLEYIDQQTSGYWDYVFLFGYYLVTFFIVNFFEAGMLIIAHARFNGQDKSFHDGIQGAGQNAGKIFVWSLISATVGVVLNFIADKFKLAGKIVSFVLGTAWNIMTYFSLPSLIIGQTTILGSFKESAAIIRKTWGETIIINVGVGLFFMGVFFGGVVVATIVLIIFPYKMVFITMVVLFVIFALVLGVVSSALSTIFKLALFEYARTGQVPSGFSSELVQNAIKRK